MQQKFSHMCEGLWSWLRCHHSSHEAVSAHGSTLVHCVLMSECGDVGTSFPGDDNSFVVLVHALGHCIHGERGANSGGSLGAKLQVVRARQCVKIRLYYFIHSNSELQ